MSSRALIKVGKPLPSGNAGIAGDRKGDQDTDDIAAPEFLGHFKVFGLIVFKILKSAFI
jgi:hypothetical protein